MNTPAHHDVPLPTHDDTETASVRDNSSIDLAQFRELEPSMLPPQSLESEQALLGALLLDNQAYESICDLVQVEDFYLRQHRIIFEQIGKLIDEQQAADAVTVGVILRDRGLESEVGGFAYINELMRHAQNLAGVVTLANTIREKAILRSLIACSNRIIQMARQPDELSARDIVSEAEAEVLRINELYEKGKRGFQPMNALVSDLSRELTRLFHEGGVKDITGTRTLFPNLDKVTSGLQAGDLIIVAGRPSMGKTTFAINIAENIAVAQGLPVAVFSLEMSAEQLTRRIVSNQASLEPSVLRSAQLDDKAWNRFSHAVERLEKSPIYIDDTMGLKITELVSRARRLHKQAGPLKCIVVDYIQLMSGRTVSDNRNLEIGEISRGLKMLAKELDCPVIALSQLSRAVDARQDKRPVMSDLRESGAIEQDADLIMFVYRDWVYHKESSKNDAEIIVAKQRNGPVGTLRMVFEGQFTRFTARTDDDGYYDEMAAVGGGHE